VAAQLLDDGLEALDRLAHRLRRPTAVGDVPRQLGQLARDLLAHAARTHAVVQLLVRSILRHGTLPFVGSCYLVGR
jgi:hypothetical protein